MAINTGKIPKWESELWHYVSSGDGMQCPLYNHCRRRRLHGWCFSDNIHRMEQILDTNQFHPSNRDFIEHLTPSRIFKLVEMLAHSFLRAGRIRCLPVPTGLISLADDYQPIEVRLVPLKSHRGALWRLKDSWIIQLNKNDPPARRRITLFHEAFHILAHRKSTPVFRKRGLEAGSFNEMLAEYFAACVLMPRKWIEEKWAEVKDLDRMVEIFDVTQTVMQIRLRELDLV